ncbi:MAG: hypothetical protein ACTSRG_01815 [Candidatus Helarchaeota archaeon]
MKIKELGVAYYGNIFLDHARQDFKEMNEHGCNAILLAMSEYDYINWRDHYFKMANIAKKEFGFKVYLNLWAWGRVFGGEAPSFFLVKDIENRQIYSKTKRSLPAACFMRKKFRNNIKKVIRKTIKESAIDGYFWDEPHYAYGKDNIFPIDLSPYFSCYCDVCQDRFYNEYGYKMPIKINKDILEFKENSIIEFLEAICKYVKTLDQSKSNTICLIPEFTEIKDWKKVCFDSMNILSTDPYWMIFNKDLSFVKKYSQKVVKIAKENNKKSQIWLLAFRIQANREDELREAIQIMENSGVESIFAWHYRGGLGNLIKSDNPELVWKIIGEVFNKLKS